jgi:hypothetical protein
MTDLEAQPGLIGQFLQLQLPQPHPRPVRATAIGGDQHSVRLRIANRTDHLMPAANRIDCELRRVVVDAKTYPAGIRCHVIDAIGRHLAEGLVNEVIRIDRIGAPLGAVIAAAILILADQFLLLVSTEMTGWPAA